MSSSWNDVVTRFVVLFVVCAGTSGEAQEQSTLGGRAVLGTAEEEVGKEAEAQAAAPATAAAQPARPPAPVVIPRKPRLSGSTTGYVENAFIGSQVRLRFDAGFGIDTPDRAEFFYAKCGCFRPDPDPDAPGPVGIRPSGADPVVTPLIEHDLDYQELQLYGEFALHPRFSLFADVPVRSLSPAVIPEATGIGDIRAGVKLGLVASDSRALTFQFRSFFPSGDSEKGLGTAHPSLEFSLFYSDRVGERVSFGAEIGTWYAVDGSSASPEEPEAGGGRGKPGDGHWSGSVLRWGAGAGVDLVARPGFEFAPVVELVGWQVLGGFEAVTPDGTPAKLSVPSAEGTSIVNLKIGGRFTFNGHHSVYVGWGVPLTGEEWYDDIVRVEYRGAF
jgi:hypothetical protein